MERNESRFTVLFQPPFWVGIAERWTQEGYQAARVVFGAEPTEPQVYQWVLAAWHRLSFTSVEAGVSPRAVPGNPKRLQRGAAKAARAAGPSTKAQEALARQREERGLAQRARRSEQRQAEQEAKFQLRQQKKREKRRGH